MSANSFNKEVKVLFDEMVEGVEDGLILGGQATSVGGLTSKQLERANDTFWVEMPLILESYDGIDQTVNFSKDKTKLSVPVSIGFKKAVTYRLDGIQLRDSSQGSDFMQAAADRISSDVNVAVTDMVCSLGSTVIKRPGATGYVDLAATKSRLTAQGAWSNKMVVGIHTDEYQRMAADLAQRQSVNRDSKVMSTYENASIGRIASYNAFELDYSKTLLASLATGVTVTAANQRYIPRSTQLSISGATENVDNRFQNLSINVTAGPIRIGDCFTIAGVFSVHRFTKRTNATLKTFRVTNVISGGTGATVIQITPPIIAADVTPTIAEIQYKNVSATPAAGAAIVMLNTVTTNIQPFFNASHVKLIGSSYQVPDDVGLRTMTSTTKQGLVLRMTASGSVDTLDTKYRFDCYFGTAMLDTEGSGILLLDQT